MRQRTMRVAGAILLFLCARPALALDMLGIEPGKTKAAEAKAILLKARMDKQDKINCKTNPSVWPKGYQECYCGISLAGAAVALNYLVDPKGIVQHLWVDALHLD